MCKCSPSLMYDRSYICREEGDTMMRKTRQLLAMFVTLVLVFGSLPFQGLAYASNAAAGGNTEGMHEELTPEGATGSGSQKPGSGNEQLALTEENAEEGGGLLEEGVTPSGNLSVQNTVTPNSTSDTEIDNIVLSMPLKDKIAQMIIPAIRTWNGENVQTWMTTQSLPKPCVPTNMVASSCMPRTFRPWSRRATSLTPCRRTM